MVLPLRYCPAILPYCLLFGTTSTMLLPTYNIKLAQDPPQNQYRLSNGLCQDSVGTTPELVFICINLTLREEAMRSMAGEHF